MDYNKTAGEEARRQLHKKAASNLEQVLAATPHKRPTVRHLPPITKTIQIRRSRHAGHCWRSRDELISDVLLWTPTHGRAKAGRPARTYIQHLCEDTRCCPEDLPEAMNDREKWWERVRDIRATSTTWWWWWLQYIFNVFEWTRKSIPWSWHLKRTINKLVTKKLTFIFSCYIFFLPIWWINEEILSIPSLCSQTTGWHFFEVPVLTI